MVKKKATKPRGVKPGRMLRPRKKVLKDSDLVPPGRLVKPPAKLTHELRRAQPYYYAPGGEAPDGTLAAGTRVTVTGHEGDGCAWVVTSQGLRVLTKTEGLRPISKNRAEA